MIQATGITINLPIIFNEDFYYCRVEQTILSFFQALAFFNHQR